MRDLLYFRKTITTLCYLSESVAKDKVKAKTIRELAHRKMNHRTDDIIWGFGIA